MTDNPFLELAIRQSQQNDFRSDNGPIVVEAYRQDRLENYLYVICALLDQLDKLEKYS